MSLQDTMRIARRADIRRLRDLETPVDRVEIHAAAFKHRGLLPLVLRYALWAVPPGGRIVILDDGHNDPASPLFEAPFNQVRLWAAKFLGADADPADFDKQGRMEFIRRAAATPPGWSAGVVFSGREAEHPDLRRCLEGLVAQPELSPDQGGEILIAGPAGKAPDWLSGFPDVQYHPYEDPPGPRFMIGRKKNFLMRQMRNPRMLVLHARIRLDEGALSRVRREFDILAPNVAVEHDGARVPYLSLIAPDHMVLGRIMRRHSLMARDLRDADPLALHEYGQTYVDGGAFMVSRRVFEACPMDEAIAWEESEDVEWCGRAFALGFVNDLAVGCGAVSSTSKLKARPNLGALHRIAWRGARSVRWLKAALRHATLAAAGRR